MKTEKKHNGLGIPEGYFSDLEKNIFQEVETFELEKGLKSRFGDTPGMTVPQEYFKNFNPRGNGSSKIVSINRFLKYSSAVAACLALFFFSGTFNSEVQPVSQTLNFDELLAEVAYDDIETLELFDTDELGTLLGEDESEENLDAMLEYLLESEDYFDEITLDILEI